MIAREQIALALDLSRREHLDHIVDLLLPEVGVLKLGSVPYAAFGPELVAALARRTRVFLDLKLHDIPNTVAAAVAIYARLGVELLTVHAAGGPAMIAAAVEAARTVAIPPRILAVTALTSLGAEDLHRIGVERPLDVHVLELARMAIEAGASGIVCAASELTLLRRELASLKAPDGRAPLLVVPGIRPAWAQALDQRRTETPAQALSLGADLLVIGRPILEAADPLAAIRRLRTEA